MAVVFVVVLFFLKNKSDYKSKAALQAGFISKNEKVGDLVNRDTDGDGVPDWEENLEDTDPGKKETTAGTPDSVAIAQKKIAENSNGDATPASDSEKNLTQTDKFSRELLSTVATLSQTGAVDQNTVDKLASSLSDQIQNPTVKKVFTNADIKTSTDNSVKAFIAYNSALNSIYEKNPATGNVMDILQEFNNDGNDVNISALDKLDPIIKQNDMFIQGMLMTSVPSSLAQLHLDMMNSLERLRENLNDIKLFDTDTVISMGAVSKYEDNETSLENAVAKLSAAISAKIKN